MSTTEPERASASDSQSPDQQTDDEPQFRYVEEFVRHQLSKTLGGPRGMIESALPFVAFTLCWVLTRNGTGLPHLSVVSVAGCRTGRLRSSSA